MATSSNPPKSILKKSTYPATTTTPRQERDREVALYHANLIQQRKEVELQILLNTEALIDFPIAEGPYSAENPSPQDARTFKELLRPFQPSDYDALILERNINEKCGFTLCPKPNAKDGAGGLYRLVGMNGNARNFRVVDKAETEKWCSEACARRGLYVRVQLSERPAWERRGDYAELVDLLDEPKSDDSMVLDGLENLSLSEETRKDTADLAWERGDRGYAARNGLVDVKIQERTSQRPAEPPSFEADGLIDRMETMHLSIEGHTTRFEQESERELWGEE